MVSRVKFPDVYAQCNATLRVGAVTYYCCKDHTHRDKHGMSYPDDQDELREFNALPKSVRDQWEFD